MQIEGSFPVAAPPEALMAHLFDVGLVASCLPGCEALEPIDADRYRAVVAVAMAGITARFELEVHITERGARAIRTVTRGEEGGNASSLQATSTVTLDDGEAGGSVLRYASDVTITGRLGRFALGMMRKKAQGLGDAFAANLGARLAALAAATAATTATTATTTATPPDAPAATATALPDAAAAPPDASAAASDTTRPTALAASTAQAVPARPAPRRPWWRKVWSWLRGEPAAPAPQENGG